MVVISTKTNYGIIEKDDLGQHHDRKWAAETVTKWNKAKEKV